MVMEGKGEVEQLLRVFTGPGLWLAPPTATPTLGGCEVGTRGGGGGGGCREDTSCATISCDLLEEVGLGAAVWGEMWFFWGAVRGSLTVVEREGGRGVAVTVTGCVLAALTERERGREPGAVAGAEVLGREGERETKEGESESVPLVE